MINLILLTLSGISQTTTQNNDSVTCLPNYQLREAIKDIERGKLYKQEIDFMKQAAKIQDERIKNFQTIIAEMKQKSLLQDKAISLLEANNALYQKSLSNKDEIIKRYRRKAAWNKAAKWIFGGTGTILGILIAK